LRSEGKNDSKKKEKKRLHFLLTNLTTLEKRCFNLVERRKREKRKIPDERETACERRGEYGKI